MQNYTNPPSLRNSPVSWVGQTDVEVREEKQKMLKKEWDMFLVQVRLGLCLFIPETQEETLRFYEMKGS